MTTVELSCPICSCQFNKYIGHVNRANKDGLKVYCGRACAGIGRRNGKTTAQKKAEKAQYDKRYRTENIETKKQKAKEYFQRTYDPAKAAIERKKRMPKHVEYCRRPEYKKWKVEYDKTHRAKKLFGEFFEAALILLDIEKMVDKREAFRVKEKYNYSSQKRKRSWKS